MTLAERAITRIREEMTERHITQRDLAKDLKCSQGRIAKLLHGGVKLRVNDVAILAAAVGITTVEALRDRGLEFYAELTPSEVYVLDKLRRRPGLIDHYRAILDADRPSVTHSRQRVSKRHSQARQVQDNIPKKRA